MKRRERAVRRTQVTDVAQARIPPALSPDDARATDGWHDDGGKTLGPQPIATAKPPARVLTCGERGE